MTIQKKHGGTVEKYFATAVPNCAIKIKLTGKTSLSVVTQDSYYSRHNQTVGFSRRVLSANLASNQDTPHQFE